MYGRGEKCNDQLAVPLLERLPESRDTVARHARPSGDKRLDMLLKYSASVVQRLARSRHSQVRSVHATTKTLLPRARPGLRPAAPRPTESMTPHASASPPAPEASTSTAVPWFMDEEVIDAEAPPPEPSPDVLPPIVWLPSYIPATSDIPEQLAQLIDMCVSGSLSALVARPAEPDDIDVDDWSERVRGSPLAVIKPMNRSETVGVEGQDWIVVVQVRGTGVGTVRRVASDITTYLKHTRPPASIAPEEIALDAILGPAQIVNETKDEEKVERGPRPPGVSRIEHELGQRLPPWQIQKLALARKYPDGWAPMSKLSHEAQHGLRLLHAADPDRFDVATLGKRFRISPESVRRILRSKWRPTEEAAQRQNMRARQQHVKGAWQREADEIAALRESLSVETEPPRTAKAAPLDTSFEHPVRVEGLVTSADLAQGRRRQKSVASRGSGDWCLIDAGWCVVHVMTAAAREHYRLEDMWRKNGAP